MKLKTIINSYVSKKSDYKARADYLEAKISHRRAQLARLEKRKSKNYIAGPSWVDEIIKPIAVEMAKNFTDRHYDILGPFGLTCETAIHFYRGNEKIGYKKDSCLSITFRPGNLDDGEITVVDYSKNTKRYGENTIGGMNGMNFKSVSIPKDVDTNWLVDFMLKSQE